MLTPPRVSDVLLFSPVLPSVGVTRVPVALLPRFGESDRFLFSPRGPWRLLLGVSPPSGTTLASPPVSAPPLWPPGFLCPVSGVVLVALADVLTAGFPRFRLLPWRLRGSGAFPGSAPLPAFSGWPVGFSFSAGFVCPRPFSLALWLALAPQCSTPPADAPSLPLPLPDCPFSFHEVRAEACLLRNS